MWARACQLYACRLRFEASVRKGEFDSISFDHLLVAIFIFVSNLLVRDLAATWNEERVRWHWQLRTEIITTYRNCSHRTRRAARSCRFTEIFFFPPRSCNRTYRARYLVYVSRYRTPTLHTRIDFRGDVYRKTRLFSLFAFSFPIFEKTGGAHLG